MVATIPDPISWLKGAWSTVTWVKGWLGRRARQKAVNTLAELRVEAVYKLLNRPVSSDVELQQWTTDEESWSQAVLKVLRENVSAAIASSFDTLGTFQPRHFPRAYNSEHDWRLSMLTKKLDILISIINRFTQ